MLMMLAQSVTMTQNKTLLMLMLLAQGVASPCAYANGVTTPEA